ncbi:hypothetical protein Bhyg_11164, partial [Pseudolycoriella hygida]
TLSNLTFCDDRNGDELNIDGTENNDDTISYDESEESIVHTNGAHHDFECVYHFNGNNVEENGYDDVDSQKDEIVIECHDEYYGDGDDEGIAESGM